MSVGSLIERLNRQGVELWFEGDNLRFRAPQGALTAELRAELIACKSEIVTLLRVQASTRVLDADASYSQRSLWFVQQQEPCSCAYHVAFVARVRSLVDVDALRKALQVIVDRHAALRTTYQVLDGDLRQRVAGYVEVSFAHQLRPGIDDDEMRAHVVADYARPFDLESGPVFRATLLTREERDHVLLLVVHHIAADGWSLFQLLDELRVLYAEATGGPAASFARPEVDYVDYAAWQGRMLSGPDGRRLADYWLQRLKGPRTELELPADRRRPPKKSSRGATHAIEFDARLSSAARQLARVEGTTLFAVLLAAFKVFVFRLTGVGDVIVGTPTFGRDRPEYARVIGDFVNTVPLRSTVDGQASFRALLATIKQTQLEALAAQEYPFPLLIERLQPARDPSRAPLFETFFILQRFDQLRELAPVLAPRGTPSTIDFGGLRLQHYPLDQQVGQFDLTLQIVDCGGPLIAQFKYAPDLFDQATIERFATQYQDLLQSAVETPAAAVSTLEFAGSVGGQLDAFNATEVELPRVRFAQQFERQVVEGTGACAVRFGGGSLTYGELDAQANRLARHLRDLGVEAGDLVGLCVGRSLDLLVALIGIQKSGGAYVPLDPHFPTERLGYMLEDSGARVLVTTAEALGALRVPDGVQVLDLHAQGDVLGALDGSDLEPVGSAEDPAYVIYTSGSTGRPKGVAVSHGALANFLGSMAREPGLSASDVLAAVTTISFDIAGLELYLPLVVGARIELISRDVAMDGEALARVLSESGATVLQATPATWRMLVESDWRPVGPLRAFCGGEALPRDLADALLGRVQELWNLYGPTETTIWSTVSRVEAAPAPITVGHPIANTRVYVLDEARQPTGIGVPGEIWIGGEGVAIGYHRRPELTAERFVADPFSPKHGARIYRTGDLGRWDAQGRLHHLGRLDHQVKIRGYRVELGEIEAVLATHPAVRQAVVVAREVGAGDTRLVAYLVPVSAGAQLDLAGMRAHLGQRLPDYMVPAQMISLPAMPLTPNGKIDRNALPLVDVAPVSVGSGNRVEPRTEIERQLAAIWSEVLEVPEIGIDDNFFELGGHSLLVVRVGARIRTRCGVEVPLRVLFELPTIRQLGDHLESNHVGVTLAPAIPVAKRPLRAPLSFAQQRLWFFQQLEPRSPLFNLSVAVRLTGRLDRSWLEASLDQVLHRHESLRTVFPVEAGEPYQSVIAEINSQVPFMDLSGYEADERDRAVIVSMRRESSGLFDLVNGPLVRTCLIRLADDAHVFVVTFHHTISDGASVAIFIRELAECYRAHASGQAPQLPFLPIQYVDFSIWQRAWLSGSRLKEQIDYWRHELEGAPPFLELPLDRPRPAAQTYSGAAYRCRLEPALQARLAALSRRENSTLFMTLFSVFVHLLGRHSGQDDVCVGVAVAGRGPAETENLIGLFINTLVLRTRLTSDMSFEELLRAVRESALGAYAHQDLPFERLVEELRPPRDLSRTPLFQVLFNMLDLGMPTSLQLPGLEISSFHQERPLDLQAKFDLTLYVQNDPGGLELTAVYNSDLFSADRIENLIDQYVNLLAAACDPPARPMREWPLVSANSSGALPDPKAPLEFVWNGSVQSRFAHHAALAPARVAVEHAAGSMTYGELEALANRIAQYLIARGIHREDCVAIYAERNAGLVAVLIGIMKAGAAFVLLDSAYPAANIAERIGIAAPKAWIDLTGRPLPDLIERALKALPLRARLGWDAAAGLDDQAWRQCADSPPMVTVAPHDLAYLVFTSGSTGAPKAIMGEHAPLSHFFQWHQDTSGLGPDDRFSVLSGLSHDPLLRDVLGALWVGATVVMPDAGRMGAPGYLADWLRSERVTVAHLTPAMADLLAIGRDAGAVDTWPTLKHVFLGGDVLTAGTASTLLRMAPRAELFNCYGTSETPQVMAIHRVIIDSDTQASQRVPVGRGIADVQLLVLNDASGLAGIGELGEICVRTPYLARGYLGDPLLTTARFVANPGTGNRDDRMYRTGDLGRYRPDGSVEYHGRRDGQVKIRGFRVELGTIEHALRALPAIGEVAVVARRDESGANALVGYLVPQPGQSVDPSDVRRRLVASLPDYMVPGAFVVLAALPLTPNGKLDRGALPEPTATAPAGDVVGPRTVLETKLHAIWEHVLGRSGIGMHDNFFDLGGHSLLAVRVFAQMERVIGAKLPISVLFQAPTLAQLAQRLEHEEFQSPWSSLVAIQPEGSKPPLFLVPGLGGNVVCYFAMARLLGADQPLYALQSRGLDGEEIPFDRVGPMAAHYLSEIRQVQRTGPYFLGGVCFGGIVAFEMAQQLRAAGEEVSFLLLLETWPAPSKRRLKRLMLLSTRVFLHLRFLTESAARHVRHLRTLSPMHLPKALLQRLKIVREIVEQRDVYRGDRVAMYADRVSTANLEAYLRYRPRPYDGKLMHVLATGRKFSGADTRGLWRKLALGGYLQFEMPVIDSGQLLVSPNVEMLAPWVIDGLDAARRDGGRNAVDERLLQGAVAVNPR